MLLLLPVHSQLLAWGSCLLILVTIQQLLLGFQPRDLCRLTNLLTFKMLISLISFYCLMLLRKVSRTLVNSSSNKSVPGLSLGVDGNSSIVFWQWGRRWLSVEIKLFFRMLKKYSTNGNLGRSFTEHGCRLLRAFRLLSMSTDWPVLISPCGETFTGFWRLNSLHSVAVSLTLGCSAQFFEEMSDLLFRTSGPIPPDTNSLRSPLVPP